MSSEDEAAQEPQDSQTKMVALDIFRALAPRHPTPDWVFLPEVRTRTGVDGNIRFNNSLDAIRSIDAFAMHMWKSKGYRRVAYEIKVSRSDWLAELKQPQKRVPAYLLSHEFWFAVAPGVWRPSDGIRELDGAGVLEVGADGSIEVLWRAAYREAWPLPESFIASLLRRAAGYFEHTRAEALTAAVATNQMSLFSTNEVSV